MNAIKRLFFFALFLIVGCATNSDERATAGDQEATVPGQKLVIAHRGASGYLPEHTLAAKAMAYAQGADYIEQDLVMTKDGEIVVLHDHYLDTVTDVRHVFPERRRDDGRYYVIDFTLEEVKQLSVSERFKSDGGAETAVFEERFPLGKSSFRVHTFAEEIELIQGLNASTGNAVGLYPEIKSPDFHHAEGKDIATAVLAELKAYGYSKQTDKVFLQCFYPNELLRIHNDLMPKMNMSLPLIQLIGTSKQYEPLLSRQGMAKVATFAAGIGPSIDLLVEKNSSHADLRITELVRWAHEAGLQVHPYTFRRDAGQIPQYANDFDDLLRIFLEQVGVDGVFTDFPDVAVRFVESMSTQQKGR